jgi:hypothetical protein
MCVLLTNCSGVVHQIGLWATNLVRLVASPPYCTPAYLWRLLQVRASSALYHYRMVELKTSMSSHLPYQSSSFVMKKNQIHKFTDAAMRQYSHKFIIDRGFKTATLENVWIERPVGPGEAISIIRLRSSSA